MSIAAGNDGGGDCDGGGGEVGEGGADGAGYGDGADGGAGVTLAVATTTATATANARSRNLAFVRAMMCAAYYAANNAANDKDDGDDDRCNPPSRAIPRPFRDVMLGTILQLPFLVDKGRSARAVAICEWLLVRMLVI